jgi:hypothetical protein
MSQNQTFTVDPDYAGLLEAFLAFPAPLALLDANGQSELVNSRESLIK